MMAFICESYHLLNVAKFIVDITNEGNVLVEGVMRSDLFYQGSGWVGVNWLVMRCD